MEMFEMCLSDLIQLNENSPLSIMPLIQGPIIQKPKTYIHLPEDSDEEYEMDLELIILYANGKGPKY